MIEGAPVGTIFVRFQVCGYENQNLSCFVLRNSRRGDHGVFSEFLSSRRGRRQESYHYLETRPFRGATSRSLSKPFIPWECLLFPARPVSTRIGTTQLSVVSWKFVARHDPWFVLSMLKAWTGLSSRFSTGSIRSGKIAPSGFLHKQLDFTVASNQFLTGALRFCYSHRTDWGVAASTKLRKLKAVTVGPAVNFPIP